MYITEIEPLCTIYSLIYRVFDDLPANKSRTISPSFSIHIPGYQSDLLACILENRSHLRYLFILMPYFFQHRQAAFALEIGSNRVYTWAQR